MSAYTHLDRKIPLDKRRNIKHILYTNRKYP